MSVSFRDFSILTFDCYGTLIDWESGIVNAMRPIVDRHGVKLSDEQILDLFAEFENIAQKPPYSNYREVLAEVMENSAKRVGFEATERDIEDFAHSVPDWPAFPDSAESLQRLKKHFKLGILSNIDDDLFEESAKRLETEFDVVVTAQQVGSYKPTPRNFEVLIERVNLPKDQILHVAQSPFHDIAPANNAGLTSVWINRRHDREGGGATPPQEAVPDLEVPSLARLADLVEEHFGS